MEVADVERVKRIEGLLIGVAVGDSLGLPAEAVSRKKLELSGWRATPWRHRFFFSSGMVSDDTEHTLMVAESIAASEGSVETFEKIFSRKLRSWFLACPPGIGFATLRACFKLCFGVLPKQSGVFSAGNGPAMRSGIIGALFPDDDFKRNQFLRSSTRITHTDPLAEAGAKVIADLVAKTMVEEKLSEEMVSGILKESGPPESGVWKDFLESFENAWSRQETVDQFAERLGMGKGVSGFVLPSVFVAVYAFSLHSRSFRQGLEAVLNCGGDTDTVGAIYGAVAGANHGVDGIPKNWIDGVRDPAWKMDEIRDFSGKLSELTSCSSARISRPWPVRFLRNWWFVMVIVGHVVLRLIPGGIGLKMIK